MTVGGNHHAQEMRAMMEIISNREVVVDGGRGVGRRRDTIHISGSSSKIEGTTLMATTMIHDNVAITVGMSTVDQDVELRHGKAQRTTIDGMEGIAMGGR
mmetsp:Transcript_23512/g.65408  ORF Transcript_23512/g.65408 Transcript_23512/m.65408 type:complete len:100 (+) Transcript_23512:866-1165(+)